MTVRDATPEDIQAIPLNVTPGTLYYYLQPFKDSSDGMVKLRHVGPFRIVGMAMCRETGREQVIYTSAKNGVYETATLAWFAAHFEPVEIPAATVAEPDPSPPAKAAGWKSEPWRTGA